MLAIGKPLSSEYLLFYSIALPERKAELRAFRNESD